MIAELTENETQLLLEALLFSASGTVCADWSEENLTTMLAFAEKFYGTISEEAAKASNIYVFDEFVDDTERKVFEKFEKVIRVCNFDEEIDKISND